VLGIRFDNWKLVFMEQRLKGTLQLWAEPFVRLRLPKIFNLRTDPYERADITSKTSEILETTRKQVHRIDEFLDDAAARARVQMDRAEMVLDDAMVRTQRTVAVVEGGILKPIVQIQGVAAGIKTALTVLLRGRPNPEDAHSDEEMFI